MSIIRQQTLEQLVTPELDAVVQSTREQWQHMTYKDVLNGMDKALEIDATKSTGRAIVIDPENSDIDETDSTVLVLPHLNGWQDHHYIRAKITQQIVAPNSRMIVLGNNSYGQQNYDLSKLSEHDLAELNAGSIRPIGELQMATLERLDAYFDLGTVGITGFSLGGRIALSMAAVGSDRVTVSHVNADEVPSHEGRNAAKLQKDFIASSGKPFIDLRSSVRESGIPALNSAMRIDRMAKDLAKFGIKSLSKDAKLMQNAMSGSVLDEIQELSAQPELLTKLGYFENSALFNPNDFVDASLGWIDVVNYFGPGIADHTTGNNLITHALLAYDGLNR